MNLSPASVCLKHWKPKLKWHVCEVNITVAGRCSQYPDNKKIVLIKSTCMLNRKNTLHVNIKTTFIDPFFFLCFSENTFAKQCFICSSCLHQHCIATKHQITLIINQNAFVLFDTKVFQQTTYNTSYVRTSRPHHEWLGAVTAAQPARSPLDINRWGYTQTFPKAVHH